MWPEEGRERQTAEAVVRLEVSMEAASTTSCSRKTEMAMGETRECACLKVFECIDVYNMMKLKQNKPES